MLLYVTFGTNDLARAQAFYDPTLATLGISGRVIGDHELAYAETQGGEPRLYIVTPFDRQPATRGNGTSLALAARSRAEVRAFHAAALAHGGSDEGAPGLRYAAEFYACYVRDPDGNKLSAAFEGPET